MDIVARYVVRRNSQLALFKRSIASSSRLAIVATVSDHKFILSVKCPEKWSHGPQIATSKFPLAQTIGYQGAWGYFICTIKGLDNYCHQSTWAVVGRIFNAYFENNVLCESRGVNEKGVGKQTSWPTKHIEDGRMVSGIGIALGYLISETPLGRWFFWNLESLVNTPPVTLRGTKIGMVNYQSISSEVGSAGTTLAGRRVVLAGVNHIVFVTYSLLWLQ
jgi:hypothetical protein